MTEKKDSCPFYHRNCPSGCQRVDCRSRFPVENKIIMESHKEICLSPEYLECGRYLDGIEFQAQRIRDKKGCPYVRNQQCGKPNNWWCMSHVPPFLINDEKIPGNKNTELLSACFGADYAECPNFIMGVKFREEYHALKKARIENTTQE